MSSLVYRVCSALVSDAEALASLTVEGWRFAYKGLLPDDFLENLSVQERAKSLREILETNRDSAVRNTRVIFCADEPGRILGVCSFGPDRSDPDSGEIYALYVSPALVGGGLGRILMQDAVTQLESAGFKEIFLWALDGNTRAINFYEKSGFRLTGEMKAEQLQGTEFEQLQMSKSVG